jgi:hypothetical protein
MNTSPSQAEHPASLPRLFVAAGKPRSLFLLAGLTLLSGAAMLPALSTMANHGASWFAFELAGSVDRSREIVGGWGSAGGAAAWWLIALDTPFLIGYGLFIAGACAATAGRAQRAGRHRLQRAATAIAWFGPLAAGADLLKNVSLALILSGHEVQPWPRASALGDAITITLMAVGLIFALAGTIATRTKAGDAILGGRVK